jgi:hypothetical protein
VTEVERPDASLSLRWWQRAWPTTGDEAPDYTAAIYGSLLVTTLTAVQWHHDAVPELIALSLVTSVAVFWLTHVWSRIVDRRVRGPVPRVEAFAIARSEATMLIAVVVPALILTLPRLTGMDIDTAIGLAVAASIGQLFLWGLAVGRAAHSTWPMALAVASVDCGLGILVVVLKVLVIH